jgi:hypothetical protein
MDLLLGREGLFFSGGTIIRDTLLSRSDAYTTTLALQAFSHYLNKKTLPHNGISQE